MDSVRAVERLIRTHTVEVEGRQALCEPLLALLREARYPSLGKTVRGAGSGMMLNTQALALYEHIDGTVRAWLDHYRQHSTGDLDQLMKRLHDLLVAEHHAGSLDDPDRMLGMFGQWVDAIEDNFDPPHEYELTGACPDCGVEHVHDEDGQQLRAVRVPVKPGRALVAECHACGRLWAGHEALTGLAESMGTEVDWVTLREFVDTPRKIAMGVHL